MAYDRIAENRLDTARRLRLALAGAQPRQEAVARRVRRWRVAQRYGLYGAIAAAGAGAMAVATWATQPEWVQAHLCPVPSSQQQPHTRAALAGTTGLHPLADLQSKPESPDLNAGPEQGLDHLKLTPTLSAAPTPHQPQE